MQILSCHIENFGKLSDCSFDFAEGVNRICEDNGFGKSTFAAFVRAMFYGLGGKGKKNDLDNERRRYKPWQGGVFGGQMILSIEGKTYIISRIFGGKDSGAEDEFELRDFDTNLISYDYSERIGEEIFGIDSESFSRTVFVGQNDCKTVATDDIHAKIGNLSEQTDDMSSFEEAMKLLESMESKLSPKKAQGSMAQRALQIQEYEMQKRNGDIIYGSLEKLGKQQKDNQKAMEDLLEQLGQLGKQQKEVEEWKGALVEKERMENLRKQRQEAQDAYQHSAAFFTKEIPSLQQIDNLLQKCQRLETARAGAALTRLSEEENRVYDRLSTAFQAGIPKPQELQSLRQRVKALQSKRSENLERQLTKREESRLEELSKRYADDHGKIGSLQEKWNVYNTMLAMERPNQIAMVALEEKRNSEKESIAEDRKKKKLALTLGAGFLGVAVIFLLLALLISPEKKYMLGVALLPLIMGIVLLILGGMKKVREENASLREQWEDLQDSIQADKQKMESIESDIKDYFLENNLPFEEGSVGEQLRICREEKQEYLRLLQRTLEDDQDQSLEEESFAIQRELGKYDLNCSEENFTDGVIQLMNMESQFSGLTEKKNKYQQNMKECSSLLGEYEEFLQTYGFEKAEQEVSQLEEIKAHVRDYIQWQKNRKEQEERWETYCQNHDVEYLEGLLTEEARLENGEVTSLSEIGKKMTELNECYADCKDKARDLQKQMEDLLEEQENYEDGQRKLEECKLLQEQEKQKYHALQLAKEKLQTAKEAMTAKYAKPMLTAFCEYYSLVTGDERERFHLDANSQITVDELGKQRIPSQLSFGSKDLIDFCLRLAMVDAMYRQEKPVLILDDPFVNLDDGKAAAAKKLLKKVGEEYQVIYCTCSEFR